MYSYKDELDLNKVSQVINKLGLPNSNDYEFVIDSRKVNHTSIFCAYPGAVTDGRNYIDDVVAKGVAAVIYEDGFDFKHNLPHRSIKNLVKYVGLLASLKYHNPSAKFKTIGITGTNGKTSISYWIAQSYSELTKKVGIIGTYHFITIKFS